MTVAKSASFEDVSVNFASGQVPYTRVGLPLRGRHLRQRQTEKDAEDLDRASGRAVELDLLVQGRLKLETHIGLVFDIESDQKSSRADKYLAIRRRIRFEFVSVAWVRNVPEWGMKDSEVRWHDRS